MYCLINNDVLVIQLFVAVVKVMRFPFYQHPPTYAAMCINNNYTILNCCTQLRLLQPTQYET